MEHIFQRPSEFEGYLEPGKAVEVCSAKELEDGNDSAGNRYSSSIFRIAPWAENASLLSAEFAFRRILLAAYAVVEERAVPRKP